VLLFSQNASRFFHAEDEIIGKELERLKIPSEIRKWAQQHNLSSHPLVIQKQQHYLSLRKLGIK
jgi:hypothetical protein